MRPIKDIVIHCADTPAGVYFDTKDIREWHIKRGFSDVGYHYVILLDGTIQLGRPMEQQGAHVRGHNRKSIGICYIGGKGGDTRTVQQKASLVYLISTLKRIFKNAEVSGHHDFKGVTKTCPEFDPKTEYKYL